MALAALRSNDFFAFKAMTGFVFTTQTGRAVDPRNLFRDLETAADKVKLEGVGVHTLRHSAATAMLENGDNLKTVSEALDHARTSITADIYVHVSEETSRAAMDKLSAALGF